MAQQSPRYRTPLSRAKGFGSARRGVEHWWKQRLTAAALVPLSIYFVYSVLVMVTSPDEDHLAGWLAQPHAVVLMSLFLIALFSHAKLGVQVIIEDYVHHEGMKFLLVTLITFTCWTLCAASLLSVLRLHFLDLMSSSL